MMREWCTVCCTSHANGSDCPGEIAPTAPEKPGWRVNVTTAEGIEAYGVLFAPCDDVWRARIMTFPNVLWKAPGVEGTMKFVGGTANEAVEQAVEFIRAHCRERGLTMRGEHTLELPFEIGGSPAGAGLAAPAQRKIRFLPVRFGVVQPSELGGTGNLSESGIFIITEMPMGVGNPLSMLLRAEGEDVDLCGQVIWMNKEHRVGRPPGMGIRLATPPADYLDFVRALA
jgi:hypothetical protein